MALTKQEVFDKVCDHFKTQTKQSYDNYNSMCSYLTDGGLKCAIGIFIPDGHPAQHCKGNVGALFNSYPDIINMFEKTEYMKDFLSDLQFIHDSAVYWSETGFNKNGWQAMEQLATDYNLNNHGIC